MSSRDPALTSFYCWVQAVLRQIVGNEADDLAQEVFLRMCKATPVMIERCRIRGWLRKVALSVVIDHLRKKQTSPVRRAIGGLEDVVDSTAREPMELLAREEQRRQLRRALEQAGTPKERAMFAAHYVKGRPQKALAEECGITPLCARVRLFRFRKRLQASIATESSE